jgi:hypothetical protein
MKNVMHNVQLRPNCMVEVDSNLRLQCKLTMLTDNLPVFLPSHGAFSKEDIDTIINYICAEWVSITSCFTMYP